MAESSTLGAPSGDWDGVVVAKCGELGSHIPSFSKDIKLLVKHQNIWSFVDNILKWCEAIKNAFHKQFRRPAYSVFIGIFMPRCLGELQSNQSAFYSAQLQLKYVCDVFSSTHNDGAMHVHQQPNWEASKTCCLC